MSGVYGNNWDSTGETRASGCVHDAGVRRYRNVFNFADSGVGGATATLTAAKLREGAALARWEVTCSVDCSAITLALGITGSTAKYSAALAGPNATTNVRLIKSTALDDDALTAPETIIITPSGNWPAAGILISDVYASHR